MTSSFVNPVRIAEHAILPLAAYLEHQFLRPTFCYHRWFASRLCFDVHGDNGCCLQAVGTTP